MPAFQDFNSYSSSFSCPIIFVTDFSEEREFYQKSVDITPDAATGGKDGDDDDDDDKGIVFTVGNDGSSFSTYL